MSDKIGENIRHKVFIACMNIERAANVESVDEETVNEMLEDALVLSRDAKFRSEYAAKRGAGAIWLDGLIKDARRPYIKDEMITERELWKWMREAKERKAKAQ